MKKRVLIILSLILCSYSCEILVDHAYFIRIPNNTSDTILVYEGYTYPDTTLSLEKPRLRMIYPNTQNLGIENKTYWKDELLQI